VSFQISRWSCCVAVTAGGTTGAVFFCFDMMSDFLFCPVWGFGRAPESIHFVGLQGITLLVLSDARSGFVTERPPGISRLTNGGRLYGRTGGMW
jgi:hypothetical protein